MENKPVIFLAFANDKEDNQNYLRNLPRELEGLRNVLRPAVQAGLCEVVERASVTIGQILDIFQDPNFKNRIAVFHFGGHAGSFELLLESLEGKKEIAHGEGLVSFLGNQKGLKLIFLNGCSSQHQALEMMHAGVPCVIGTNREIDDEIATTLSQRFYNGIAGGAPVQTAWKEAVDEVKMRKGTSGTRALNISGKQVESDTFPWSIFFKEGADRVQDWNLPDEVNNPLFGLPEIPRIDNLPDSPFLFFKRYERKHAEVFFGRSYYIRDLYNKVADPTSPPLILVYGQTGVGKSSLFDAGLNPRLENSHEVIYLRRDPQFGLLETLKTGLKAGKELRPDEIVKDSLPDPDMGIEKLRNFSAQSEGPLKEELEKALQNLERKKKLLANFRRDEVATGELRSLWLSQVKATNKPLLIILDQVEEIFTRPISGKDEELQDFLNELSSLFHSPQNYPPGKILLGFRKEYQPEIEDAIKNFGIPRSGVFLEQLKERDIVEIFSGLTQTPDLRKQYNLDVEPGLPRMIAQDLLEDKNSAVAPVLQILLTKMWEEAKQINPAHPVFTIRMYQDLKRDGILLADFFQQQMEKLKASNPDEVNSGLAISILNYHTTELGTSGVKSRAQLEALFPHRKEILPRLLSKLKELYLLTEAGAEASSLTHDTLAPLVQMAFKDSMTPGPRASRILTQKVTEFRNDTDNLLDRFDLQITQNGQSGMRVWTEEESELVNKSAAVVKRQHTIRRAVQITGFVMMILILITSVISFIWYGQAEVEKRNAIDQKMKADSATTRALAAVTQMEKAQLARLESQKAKEAALESANRNAHISDSLAHIADEEKQKAQNSAKALSQTLDTINSKNTELKLLSEKALNSEQEAVTQAERAKKLWMFTTGRSLVGKAMTESKPEIAATLGAMGLYLYLTNSGENDMDIAWDLLKEGDGICRKILGNDYNQFQAHPDNARKIEVLPDGSGLISAGGDGTVYLWDIDGINQSLIGVPKLTEKGKRLMQCSEGIRCLAVSEYGNYAAVNEIGGKISMAETHKSGRVLLSDPELKGNITGLAFGGNEQSLASISDQGEAAIWNIFSRKSASHISSLPGKPIDIHYRSMENSWLIITSTGVFAWKGSSEPAVMLYQPSSAKNITASTYIADQDQVILGFENGGLEFVLLPGTLGTELSSNSIFTGIRSPVTALLYNKEIKRLAAALRNGELVFIEPNSQIKAQAQIHLDDGFAWDFAVSERNDLLLSSDSKGNIHFWTADPNALYGRWCDFIPSNYPIQPWYTACIETFSIPEDEIKFCPGIENREIKDAEPLEEPEDRQ